MAAPSAAAEQGRPTAAFCRWCGRKRARGPKAFVLACAVCDAGPSFPRWPHFAKS